MLAVETHLDRLAIPNLCTAVSHCHSAEHCEEPSLNSSASEEDLHVLVPTKTYSTKSITSLTEEPIPIQSDIFLCSLVSPDQSLPQKPSLFQKKTPLFPLVLQMKVLLVENVESLTFKFLPQSTNPSIL